MKSELNSNKKCYISTVKQHYQVGIYDVIEETDDYEDFLDLLHYAHHGDIVDLLIGSPGGCVDVGRRIIRAIKRTRAQVNAVIVEPSASMASMIAMACDSLHMESNTYLMFHTWSGGMGGKSVDIVEGMIAEDRVMRQMTKDLCRPFLSSMELHDLDLGAPIYIYDNDEELLERIDRHFDIRG